MDDFISLGSEAPKPEEVDVLQLTRDITPPSQSPTIHPPDHTSSTRSVATVKPFYPRCKRVLTRPPFYDASKKQEEEKKKQEEEKKKQEDERKKKQGEEKKKRNEDVKTGTFVVKSTVSQLSLEQLMSVSEAPALSPPKKQPPGIPRLRILLRQAEAEKRTLQGYVADLQAKLAAVPKPGPTRSWQTQTSEEGLTCPTCSSTVEPTVLLKSFGADFVYNEMTKQFVQKSTGLIYNPHSQLFLCKDNDILYYWDSVNSIYHYHSKNHNDEETSEDKDEEEEEEEEEEEGELTEDQKTPDDLEGAANSAMKESGVEFIANLNMYFNQNTGLHYCQSSGLYYDTKMSVFYTLANEKYIYHSNTKSNDSKSAYAKTCIRAIVKETSCHKVKPGMLYMFTCMGGTIGREGSHVAVFPEIRVSKRHATFTYCSGKYYVADEGTMNGTFLNNTRLSTQKEVSQRFELSHLDELRVGSTTLQLHIHANLDTCKWCEPGLAATATASTSAVTASSTAPNTVTSSNTISEPPALYKQRQTEVNRLKRKYQLR